MPINEWTIAHSDMNYGSKPYQDALIKAQKRILEKYNIGAIVNKRSTVGKTIKELDVGGGGIYITFTDGSIFMCTWAERYEPGFSLWNEYEVERILDNHPNKNVRVEWESEKKRIQEWWQRKIWKKAFEFLKRQSL